MAEGGDTSEADGPAASDTRWSKDHPILAGVVRSLIVLAILSVGTWFFNLFQAVEVKPQEPARIGRFEIRVFEPECGQKRIEELAYQRAQGQFCLVGVSFLNDSNEAGRPFFDWTLYVGSQSYDHRELFGAPFDRDTFPGQTELGAVVFDVPEGTQPTRLQVDDYGVWPFDTTIWVSF